MKKIVLFSLLAVGAVFQFCSSAKKAQASAATVSYTSRVQPIIQANCSPCHIPPQGRAKPLNTYEAARANVDDMLVRMKRSPDEKGFMPMKHPKLPDSTIAVFEKWKESGLAE